MGISLGVDTMMMERSVINENSPHGSVFDRVHSKCVTGVDGHAEKWTGNVVDGDYRPEFFRDHVRDVLWVRK